MATIESPIPTETRSPIDIDLRRALQILRERAVWILASITAFVALAVAYNEFTPPIHEATVLVLLEPNKPKITAFADTYITERASFHYFQSQYKLVQSVSVIKAAAERTGVLTNPKSEFFQAEDIVSSLQSRISVRPERNSQLMRVVFLAQDPAEAQQLANAVVDAYINMDEERRGKISSVAIQWLTETLPDIRGQLQEAEENLLAFKKQTGILSLEGRLKNYNGRLAQLIRELDQVRIRRIQMETLHQQLDGDGSGFYLLEGYSVASRALSDLRQEKMRLEMQQITESHTLGPQHPTIRTLEQKRNLVGMGLKREQARVAADVKKNYQAALEQERRVRTIFDEAMTESKNFSGKAVEFERLQREVDNLRRLYDPLVKRLEEVNLVSNLAATHIHVVDPADLPRAPVKPRKRLNIFLGILAGLFMGIALAFLVDYLDDSIHTPDELTSEMKAPLIGVIPHFDLDGAKDDGEIAIIALQKPHSPASEAFRALRTSILLSRQTKSDADGEANIMLVTSAEKEEGKTTIALNLAVVMAQAGKRVLLVDTDLRRPSIHKNLGLENSVGLTTVMSGETTLSDAVQPTKVEGFYFLASGATVAQPAEMVGSEAFERIIRQAASDYDTLILDSPPLVAVTDAVLMSRLASGVIQVVRSGHTSRRSLRRGLELLNFARPAITKLVLNNLSSGGRGYYYSYYRYYYPTRS